MKPILFDENATSFNTNGLGRLDCISCQVVEERNGMFELELQIAETALHAKQIEMSSIIVAKPSQDKGEQAFRVYKITKPIGGIFSVYARHISYQLSFIPVMPFAVTASAQAANQTLQGLKTNAVESCPFNFVTDVTTVASYKQTVPASLRSRLGGVEGSVLDQFGGEYEWDNYTVNLWRNRGVTTPRVTLRYGKNITDLNQEKNIEDTITGIVPYWQDSEGENTLTLPEKVVESQTAGSYPFKRTVPYDFSQSFEEETIPTEAQLRAKATAYINQAGIGVPKVSIKVSFINLADTVEYKSIAALQTVELCDEVGVYFEKLGIETTAKVVKTEYNVLAERYNSIELGSLRSTLANTISGQQDSMNTLANNTKRMFSQYNNTVGEMIDTATAWLTSGDGFVVAHKDPNTGEWKELLFMDTADEATAHNVLRINQNGIGFSSTGVGGPYTQAWTLDGRMVIGGTNVPSLTVYDNNQNIIFQTSRSGTIWNSTNSSMNASGVLRAVGAILTNAEIISTTTTGAGVDVNATNGKIIFKWQGNDIATIVAKRLGNSTYLDITSDDYMSLNADESIKLDAGNTVEINSDNYMSFNASGSMYLDSDQSVDITSGQSINIESNQGRWSGDYFYSGVQIGSNNLTLYTDNRGAIYDFSLDWSHHTNNFILGDQYENLGIDTDGYGGAWLTYDMVIFYGGQGFEFIDGVDVESVYRINVWGN